MIHSIADVARDEVIEFDHAVLADICRNHGDQAEAVIADRLGRIETLLHLAQDQINDGHHGGLMRSCRDLVGLAREIGMRTLVRAAIGVIDCLEQGQDQALRACTRRMLHLGRPETVSQWTVRHDTVA
ncbi:hypothetical protein [Jannaschia sp. M317]|uniref:hypothetical protein n=1 Tax=Jannaschia sp. M317 TaxID=2867011 RepID=UPI0021A3B20A|nr:hypothetical protein [Jannaschia sp. M317]UWQ18095.1 hypothetical protein K3551_01950 [Jannaschia sp. M317]